MTYWIYVYSSSSSSVRVPGSFSVAVVFASSSCRPFLRGKIRLQPCARVLTEYVLFVVSPLACCCNSWLLTLPAVIFWPLFINQVEKFVESFGEEVTVPQSVPRWLWGGDRAHWHPTIRVRYDETDFTNGVVEKRDCCCGEESWSAVFLHRSAGFYYFSPPLCSLDPALLFAATDVPNRSRCPSTSHQPPLEVFEPDPIPSHQTLRCVCVVSSTRCCLVLHYKRWLN